MTLNRRHITTAFIILLILALTAYSFSGIQKVFAATEVDLTCTPTSAAAGTATTFNCAAPVPATWLGSTQTYCGITFTSIWDTPATGVTAVWVVLDGNVVEWDWDYESASGMNMLSWGLLACGGGDPDPHAAGIWASHLCEPDDGFSLDGWSTLDADTVPPDTKLWVAPGPDGPWSPTEFMQPPYVMSTTHVDGLTAWMGLTDYHDLWFKAGETGTPANYGSLIEDREAFMNDLCGS